MSCMTGTRLRHIVISEENYLSLKNMGKAGESFNDVLNKLLKSGEACNAS